MRSVTPPAVAADSNSPSVGEGGAEEPPKRSKKQKVESAKKRGGPRKATAAAQAVASVAVADETQGERAEDMPVHKSSEEGPKKESVVVEGEAVAEAVAAPVVAKEEKPEKPEKDKQAAAAVTVAKKERKKREVQHRDDNNEEEEEEEDESLCGDCAALVESAEMTALRGMLPQLGTLNLAAMLTDCDRDVERAANLYLARPAFVQKTYRRAACAHLRK